MTFEGCQHFFANRAYQPNILPALTSPDEVTVPRVYQLVAERHKVHDLVTDLIPKGREKQARFYNKKQWPLTKPYDIGDKV